MKASLNFNNYFVLETYYYNNPFLDADQDENRDLTPHFQWSIEHKDKEGLSDAGVFLKVIMGDKEDGPFCVEAQILGLFTIDSEEGMSLEDKERLYRINAIAILFPYLRSLVSDLTSKGNDADQIILPPLNVHGMMKKSLQEE